MVLAHLAYTGSRVALSLYALQLGASAFTVGLLMSLLAVIPVLMSVSIGRWTDRAGPVLPSLLALALVTTGVLLPWFAQTIAGLCAASMMLGTGFTIAHVAVNNAVGHVSTPEKRALNFNYLALGFSTTTSLTRLCHPLPFMQHTGRAISFGLRSHLSSCRKTDFSFRPM